MSVSRRSNRNRRPARIEKAQTPGVGTGATVYTAAQVKAMLDTASAGGQIAGGFNPLPRMDPQVAFGPGLPLIPAAIDPVRRDTGRPEPRFNEYPVSTNLPGVTDRLIPWKVLRDAAAAGGIPRRCIQIRKDEISTLNWAISITKAAVTQAEADHPGMARADVEADLRKRLSPEIARCSAFWERPDPGQDEDWTDWAGKLLEEHLVLDAIAIYPRRTYGGDVFAMEILDGSTIKALRDFRGGKPLPPNPSYQQILWGFPRGEYLADTDEDGKILNAYGPDTLIYKRRNVRADTLYGHSAVEQCLEDLDVWLRRRSWIRAEYTDGSIPSGLLRNTMESSWTPAQVLEYEQALNDAWSGQTLERHRMRILPPGFELEQMPDVAERYKPEYDLFLLKQLAAHFSTTIAELNFTEPGGMGSSGYHEGQADIKDRTATMPTYRWLQGLITGISRRHLRMPPELEFKILGLEDEDEAAADQVAQNRLQYGRMTLNEDRDRLGLPRYGFAEADMPMLMTTRGVVYLEGSSALAPAGEIVEPPKPAPANAGAAPAADPDPDAESDDGDGQADGEPSEAVKSEVASFRRWAKRNPRGTRQFRCAILTKADAPEDLWADSRIVFAEPEAVAATPKGRDQPGHWPGWDRDLTTADKWTPRIIKAVRGSMDTRALAERWLSEQLVKADGVQWTSPEPGADPWATTAALAFLHRHGITVIPAMAFLRLVWLEGYAVGHTAAKAVLAGRDKVDAWGWAEGDAAGAERTLSPEDRSRFEQWSQQASAWATSIGGNRLKAVAKVLAGGRSMTAAALAKAVDDALAPKSWARRVAVTELTRASSAGAADAYRAGGVQSLIWVTSQDEAVCIRCQTDEPAGPIPIGGTWPDGTGGPPSHDSCRCGTLPAWPTNNQRGAAPARPFRMPRKGGLSDVGPHLRLGADH